jgi:hypothetical protein
METEEIRDIHLRMRSLGVVIAMLLITEGEGRIRPHGLFMLYTYN